jgi:hypothetical protein
MGALLGLLGRGVSALPVVWRTGGRFLKGAASWIGIGTIGANIDRAATGRQTPGAPNLPAAGIDMSLLFYGFLALLAFSVLRGK